LKRLARSPEARAKFVESQISNGIAFQIRAMRKKHDWLQSMLAEKVGTTQNQIYRLENPATIKPRISTLKRIAAVFDVALVVRFVPFSQVIAWASGISFTDKGLSTSSLAVLSFDDEQRMQIETAKRETPRYLTSSELVVAAASAAKGNALEFSNQNVMGASDSNKVSTIDKPILLPRSINQNREVPYATFGNYPS
jgi:DNA-binding XRE family transcriptional regulator